MTNLPEEMLLSIGEHLDSKSLLAFMLSFKAPYKANFNSPPYYRRKLERISFFYQALPKDACIAPKRAHDRIEQLIHGSQSDIYHTVQNTQYGFLAVIATPSLLMKYLTPFNRQHHQTLLSRVNDQPRYYVLLLSDITYRQIVIEQNMICVVIDFAKRFPLVLKHMLTSQDLWGSFCQLTKRAAPFNIDGLLQAYNCNTDFRAIINSGQFNDRIDQTLGTIHAELLSKIENCDNTENVRLGN